MASVVNVIQTSYVTSSKTRSQIKDLKNKAAYRYSNVDSDVIFWLSIALGGGGFLNPFLSAAGIVLVLNQSAAKANLKAEEDLYDYIYQQFDRGYSYVKLKQKYHLCTISTEDGGVIQKGWIKSGLPTVVSYVF